MSNPQDPTAAKPDLIVRSNRVVLPTGERRASIHVSDGRIVAIASHGDLDAHCLLHDAGDLVVMPGLVDTHVHINEPGRTDWEGFQTATRAAAAGGVTTLIEMPLNSIPATTTAGAYRQKITAANGKLSVDVGFWGGLVPGNACEIVRLWEAGAFGFKCFLVPSGVDEFEAVAEGDLRAALPVLTELGAPLLVHAELPGPINDAVASLGRDVSPKLYATWLASRPRQAEDEAVALLLGLAREYGTHIHIVHLCSSMSIDPLKRARAEGLRVTAETCPHYLTFCAEEIPLGATQYKCAPPIRERENRERLWSALGDGTIDFAATDHSPCPPGLKLIEEGDFLRAWGGIASLQLALPAVWTGARSHGYSIERLTDWVCAAPARLAGLDGKKGALAVGCDADFVVWDPDRSFRVDAEALHHRHKVTPYAGRELAGIVETTFLRGRKIFDRGTFLPAPSGKVLQRRIA